MIFQGAQSPGLRVRSVSFFRNAAKKAGAFVLRSWHPYFFLSAAAILLYCKTLAFRFTGSDDVTFAEYARHLLQAGGAGKAIFAQSLLPGVFEHFYRPLLMFSWVFDTWTGGGHPFAYHLTNVLLHAGASCLVYLVLDAMGNPREYSFWASLVFSAHPALAQSVAWISGRNDTLLATGIFLSFYCLVRYGTTHRRYYYFLHLLVLSFALFVKESAVPAVVLFAFYVLLQEPGRFSVRSRWTLALGWLAAVFLWYGMRSSAAGLKSAQIEMVGEDILRSFPALVSYVGKVLFPFNLSVRPYIQDLSPGWGIAATGLITCGIIAAARKRAVPAAFAVAWFLLFLVPTLISQSNYYEHRLYVPLLGLLMVLPAMRGAVPRQSRIIRMAAFLVVPFFAAMTFHHSDAFMNRRSFWENAAVRSPHSLSAHQMFGKVLALEKQYDRAEKEFLYCRTLSGAGFDIEKDIALLYMQEGRFREADEVLRRVLSEPQNYADFSADIAFFHYARLRQLQGDLPAAEKMYLKAVRTRPGVLDYYRGLVELSRSQGDAQKERRYLRLLGEDFRRNQAAAVYIDPSARRWYEETFTKSTGFSARAPTGK